MILIYGVRGTIHFSLEKICFIRKIKKTREKTFIFSHAQGVNYYFGKTASFLFKKLSFKHGAQAVVYRKMKFLYLEGLGLGNTYGNVTQSLHPTA